MGGMNPALHVRTQQLLGSEDDVHTREGQKATGQGGILSMREAGSHLAKEMIAEDWGGEERNTV